MQPEGSPPASIEQVLETETVLETYANVAEWIRFADAKAAVTLTVNGVLASVLIPAMKAYLSDDDATPPPGYMKYVVWALFVGWLIGLIVSATSSFRCILPIRGKKRQMTNELTSHFHPAAISQKYPLEKIKQFVDECDRMSPVELKREVLGALLIDAHLSSEKYGHVGRSIRWLGVSVGFAIFFLVATFF